MFVDSAFRFQCSYGTRDKSTSSILGVVQRFVADMEVPQTFRTDIRGQRFSLPVPVRDAGQERIYHPWCDAPFRGRHGSSASISDGQRRLVHQLDVR